MTHFGWLQQTQKDNNNKYEVPYSKYYIKIKLTSVWCRKTRMVNYITMFSANATRRQINRTLKLY